jgi:hypothetical protein
LAQFAGIPLGGLSPLVGPQFDEPLDALVAAGGLVMAPVVPEGPLTPGAAPVAAVPLALSPAACEKAAGLQNAAAAIEAIAMK